MMRCLETWKNTCVTAASAGCRNRSGSQIVKNAGNRCFGKNRNTVMTATGRSHHLPGQKVFLYEDPLKESLMGLKFRERKEYGIFLGRLMGLYGADFIRQVHPQVIFPVPIHRKKKSVRGYNQAEVLAREISRGFSIPLRTDLVLRKKSTKAQKELSRKERKKNMERAFVVKKEAGMYRDILLVDDIYTTGSTANAIAGKLKAVGVKNVYVLTLCIGKGI